MPLLREPDTETLEDHLFGSGAWQYGWFDTITSEQKFPVTIIERNPMTGAYIGEGKTFHASDFIEAIKWYATQLPERTFDDLIEDMDAFDVDCCIQFMMFGEIRFA